MHLTLSDIPASKYTTEPSQLRVKDFVNIIDANILRVTTDQKTKRDGLVLTDKGITLYEAFEIPKEFLPLPIWRNKLVFFQSCKVILYCLVMILLPI